MAAANGKAAARKFWFDPRFAIGVVLIAASVIGTVLVVSAADATTEVLAARSALVPGQTVSADDLSPVRVTLSDESLYLAPDDVGNREITVTRAVSEGELIPASAVGSIEGLDFTTVVVELDSRLAESVAAGGTGDLWATSKGEDGAYGAPSVIVPAATVVRIVEPEGIVVSEAAASVELLVPRESAARLLEAMANDAALELLPTALPVEG